MSNLLTLTSAQLIKAANIKDKIEALTKELNGLLGSSAQVKSDAKPSKRGMSAAGRARIAAAAKLRWAKIKAAKATPKAAVKAKPVQKKKSGMSAAGRARIVAAQKARWAKIKAAKPVAPKTAPKAAAKPAQKLAKKKFVMSAAAKAKISAAAKLRWAKI